MILNSYYNLLDDYKAVVSNNGDGYSVDYIKMGRMQTMKTYHYNSRLDAIRKAKLLTKPKEE